MFGIDFIIIEACILLDIYGFFLSGLWACTSVAWRRTVAPKEKESFRTMSVLLKSMSLNYWTNPFHSKSLSRSHLPRSYCASLLLSLSAAPHVPSLLSCLNIVFFTFIFLCHGCKNRQPLLCSIYGYQRNTGLVASAVTVIYSSLFTAGSRSYTALLQAVLLICGERLTRNGCQCR